MYPVSLAAFPLGLGQALLTQSHGLVVKVYICVPNPRTCSHKPLGLSCPHPSTS